MNKLYVDAGTVIVNLLKEDQKNYLPLNRLKKLTTYIALQLEQEQYLDKYDVVVFNVNFESIERTVLCNSHLFELVGHNIVLKEEKLSSRTMELFQENKDIIEIIHTFCIGDAV